MTQTVKEIDVSSVTPPTAVKGSARCLNLTSQSVLTISYEGYLSNIRTPKVPTLQNLVQRLELVKYAN